MSLFCSRRIYFIHIYSVITLLLTGIFIPWAQAQADCRDLEQALIQAREQHDLQALAIQAAKIDLELACTGSEQIELKRYVARTYFGEAARLHDATASLAEQRAMLEKADIYHILWYVKAMLGDIALQDKVYYQAFQYYQEAIELMDNPVLTPKKPNDNDIKTIRAKAEEAWALADGYVMLHSNTRDGALAGVARSQIRGFKIKRFIAPITFYFDSIDLTPKGQQAAQQVAELLQREQLKAITLEGHTDQIGESDYNQELSERRATTIKDYLQRQGYDGVIKTIGFGKSRPRTLNDHNHYRQEEIDALNRRVELVRH